MALPNKKLTTRTYSAYGASNFRIEASKMSKFTAFVVSELIRYSACLAYLVVA